MMWSKRCFLAAAVFATVAATAEASAGQGHPGCKNMTLEECVKKYWDGPMKVTAAFLDTMNTWTEGADWVSRAPRGTDCDKVRNATREAALFANKKKSEAKKHWPTFLDVFWGLNSKKNTPPDTDGEHFHADWVVEIEGADTFTLPHHAIVLNELNVRYNKHRLFLTWLHELGHHAGLNPDPAIPR